MNCPLCKKPMARFGEIRMDARLLDVYQCDTCTVPWPFDGEVFEAALTVAIDQDGNLFDPETLDPFVPPGTLPGTN